MEKIDKLKRMINEVNNIVFFGGAGVSTLSGLKDFRSKDGLYNIKYDYPPEQILSHSFFMSNTAEFYKFYKDKMNPLNFSPNIIHKYLTTLEKENKLSCIITQNIDGFHTTAGSKNVLELHGSVHRNYCIKCNKFYDAKYVFNSKEIPKCECGGIIKPDVVLYEEDLDKSTLENSIKHISNADVLIIAGTSLTVYPASGLINYFNGKYLVLINNTSTNYDNNCDLIINEDLKKVFEKL